MGAGDVERGGRLDREALGDGAGEVALGHDADDVVLGGVLAGATALLREHDEADVAGDQRVGHGGDGDVGRQVDDVIGDDGGHRQRAGLTG